MMMSKITKSDAERFAEYKAKRMEQKNANKARLAAEFPLLFGQDEKTRSTIGKYTNKAYPTTPSKKTVKKAAVAIVDENKGFSKSAPIAIANPQPRVALSPKKMSLPAYTKKPSMISFVGSFSSSNNVIEPFEMEMKDVLRKAPLLKAPATAAAAVAVEEIEPTVEDNFSDQLNDALGYLLESNEVDLSKHKRLSTHSFSKETIRRLSIHSSSEIKRLEMKRASILPQVASAVEESKELMPALVTANEPEAMQPSSTKEAVEEAEENPLEVDDLDVLNALRIYIAQLGDDDDVEPAPAVTTVRDDSNAVVEVPTQQEEVAVIADVSTILVKMKEAEEEVVMGAALSPAPDGMQMVTNVNAVVPTALSKPQDNTVLFPRMTFFQEVMRKGLVQAEVANWVRRDGHVKYVVYISVSAFP